MKRPMDVDVLLQNGTKMEIYKAGKYFPQYMAGTIDLSTTNLSDPDLVRFHKHSMVFLIKTRTKLLFRKFHGRCFSFMLRKLTYPN